MDQIPEDLLAVLEAAVNLDLSSQQQWEPFKERYCGLDTNTLTSSMVGFMVTTRCSFHGPIKFPQNPLGALGVEKIGRSSLHY
ncbi:unnamed protein product [Caretta caretta]